MLRYIVGKVGNVRWGCFFSLVDLTAKASFYESVEDYLRLGVVRSHDRVQIQDNLVHMRCGMPI